MLPFAIFALLAVAGLSMSTMVSTPEIDEPDDALPDDMPDDDMMPVDMPDGETPPVDMPDGETPPVDMPDGETPDVDVPDDENPDDLPVEGPIGVGLNEVLTGTDGDDTFALSDEALSPNPENNGIGAVSIDGGAGDDVINLLVPDAPVPPLSFEGPYVSNGQIFGGDGNDQIDVSATESNISGGAGDDVLTIYNALGTNVFGGDGNDTIGGTQESGDIAVFSGGAGDDILDATGIENGRINGDDGNDTLIISGASDSGAGYGVVADGGAGEDIIQFTGPALTDTFFGANRIGGGAGADTFELTLNEGTLDSETILGDIPTEASSDGTIRYATVDIADFEPGVDMLVVNADSVTDDFTLSTARIEAVTGTADIVSNQLILRYESDTAPARDVFIDVGTSDLTFEDIRFVGTQIPTLQLP